MIRFVSSKSPRWGLASLSTRGASHRYGASMIGLGSNLGQEKTTSFRGGHHRPQNYFSTSCLLNHQSTTKRDFGLLDTNNDASSSLAVAGEDIARRVLDKVAMDSKMFHQQYQRKPTLAVITAGDASEISKVSEVGTAHGIEVKEICLEPSSTTQDDLLSVLYQLRRDDTIDGIQLLTSSFPSPINPSIALKTIPLERDVDGIHYSSEMQYLSLSSSSSSNNLSNPTPQVLPPATHQAVLELLHHSNIQLKDKKIVLIGGSNSRMIGSSSSLAQMLHTENDAIVTMIPSSTLSSTQTLQTLVESADIVISCADDDDDVFSLAQKWIQPKTIVIDVGHNSSSSILGDMRIAYLCQNVLKAAQHRELHNSKYKDWTRHSGYLERTYHFDNYTDALTFANQVNDMSTQMDHHANMTFKHECVCGVNLNLQFFSYEANEVTHKDYEAAQKVEELFQSINNESSDDMGVINMSDYTYDLQLENIAKYPAEPRGSSRLLRVDSDGNVSHYPNFSESFLDLAKDALIVFNESRVVKARLTVTDTSNSDEGLEMMILTLNHSMVQSKLNGAKLNVMIRKENVQLGDVFTEKHNGDYRFKVVEIVSPWIEDEHSQGCGTECIIECMQMDLSTEPTVGDLLELVGTVPIPPYLGRDAENMDESSYNNVYASESIAGSVAAPTAGLHFTDDLLQQIGDENLCFLSLHVGAGTFQPVVTENARDHSMHGENYGVDVSELRRIMNALQNKQRIIVVGTTSCRTLESIYWSGVKILTKNNTNEDDVMTLGQEEWISLKNKMKQQPISSYDALQAVLDKFVNEEKQNVIQGRTSLMIVPKTYDFKVVDELVTNFHAPDSTLMLLVSSFLGSGEKIRRVYEEAQRLGYRFLSYGDVCFFSKPNK